jgi:hypothetical protein
VQPRSVLAGEGRGTWEAAPISRFRLLEHATDSDPRVALSLGLPQMPSGFRAEDELDAARSRGFVPLYEAAEQMGLDEEEVVDLARRGLLDAVSEGAISLVRPAIVTMAHIAGGSAQLA